MRAKSFGLFFIVLILLGTTSQAKAQHNFGLGIILGDPTGISAKYDLSRRNAVDGALSFSSSDIHIHSTYLWLRPKLFVLDRIPVTWYFGIGARLQDHDRQHWHNNKHDDHVHFGPRAPVGLRIKFRDPRFEVFTEVSMTMDLVPETDLDLNFGLGVRFYF